MEKSTIDFLTKTWFIPVVAVLLLVLVLINRFDFSFSDFVANKVINKLEADYSPYGPNGNPENIDD